MVKYWAFFLLSTLFAEVRTAAVTPTPESQTVALKIAFPRDGRMAATPVWVQFRIDGFALGAASQFQRAEEIAVSKLGQTVHVVIDNYPYIAINEPAVDPFDESTNYYMVSYKFKIPFDLDYGAHTIRMFPARSYGESLKGDNTYAATQFFVGTPGECTVDLTAPYITYSEPSPNTAYEEGRPILLDFYVSNTELSPDGYKVRLSIDGKINRLLTVWLPYYILDLPAGEHTIRLELLDSKNQIVPGPFNDVTETIVIYPS